ncbi:MAG: holin family protein [Pseudomonadota bacterium]
MVNGFFGRLFGAFSGGAVKDTIEVFRPNAEASAGREHDRFIAALEQLAAEKSGAGFFNRIVDGLNRLPRPAMAFGTIGLFVFAMADPDAFAVRISTLSLVPEPMWWLLGAIVSFYFGAREIAKNRDASVARTMSDLAQWRAGTASVRAEIAARDPEPIDLDDIATPSLDELPDPPDPEPSSLIDFAVLDDNPALSEEA